MSLTAGCCWLSQSEYGMLGLIIGVVVGLAIAGIITVLYYMNKELKGVV